MTKARVQTEPRLQSSGVQVNRYSTQPPQFLARVNINVPFQGCIFNQLHEASCCMSVGTGRCRGPVQAQDMCYCSVPSGCRRIRCAQRLLESGLLQWALRQLRPATTQRASSVSTISTHTHFLNQVATRSSIPRMCYDQSNAFSQ